MEQQKKQKKQKKNQLMTFVAQKYFVDDNNYGDTIRFLEITKKHITIQIGDIIETRENIKYSTIYKKCIFDSSFISISECRNGQNIDGAIIRYHQYHHQDSSSDSSWGYYSSDSSSRYDSESDYYY